MIELMPFQQRAVNQLLALGTRKLVIADPGVGARTIMARASKEFNDKIVIAPVVLKNEWERLLGVSMKFISLNTPYAIDKVRGYRLPLAMVEISVLTDLKLDLILELLTRMDNV